MEVVIVTRFFEAEFYHNGENKWVKVAFNVASIEMAQPDRTQPDHSRVWLASGDSGDPGFCLRLTWPELLSALCCVQK